MNKQQFLDMAKSSGFGALQQVDGYSTIYSTTIMGYRTLVLLTEIDAVIYSFQLYVGFGTQATVEKVNEWNAGSRFIRAYKRKSDSVVALEFDVPVVDATAKSLSYAHMLWSLQIAKAGTFFFG